MKTEAYEHADARRKNIPTSEDHVYMGDEERAGEPFSPPPAGSQGPVLLSWRRGRNFRVIRTDALPLYIHEKVSGRALARAPLGGGFPALPFRLQGGFSVPPSATFPAALPKIRTSGFPTVRLQAAGTLQFGTELSAAPPRLRLIRPCPRTLPAFSPSFDDPARRRGTPPRCAAPPRRPRRHLCPEVLAPSGLCCPGLPRLPTSSASQENSRPFPGIRRL